MKKLLTLLLLLVALPLRAQTGTKIVFDAAVADQTGAIQSAADTSSVGITFCGAGYSGVLYVDAASTSAALAEVWTTTLTTNSDCTTVYTEIPALKWHRVRWTLTAGTLNVWMVMTRGGTTASYSTMAAPTGAVAGNVAVFLGSPLRLSYDGGITYAAATDTATITRVLVGDGTAAAPSIALASATGLGFYKFGSALAVTLSSSRKFTFSTSYNVSENPTLWINSTISTALTSPAAASLQLGAVDSATPVAQTLRPQGATGTNTAAAATFTIETPRGTGTGAPGRISIVAAQTGTTGSTVHTVTERLGIDKDRVTAPYLAAGIATVSAAATGSIAAADLRGTLLLNYSQAAENTSTLAAADAGYNFIAAVGAAGAGAWHIKPAATDKIYLDGTALDDADKASLGTPAVGNTLTCVAFQTGASAWDWICTSGGGAVWSDGGA